LATQRLLSLKEELPRSAPKSVSGRREVPLAILPINLKESEDESPKVTLPLARRAPESVVVPATESAPPAVKVSETYPV